MPDINQLLSTVPKGANLKDFQVIVPLITQALGVDEKDEEALAVAQSAAARVLDSPMLGLFGMAQRPGTASFSSGLTASSFDWNQIIGILLPFIISFVQGQIQKAQEKPVPAPAPAPTPTPTPVPTPSPTLVRGYASLHVGVSMFSRKGNIISKGSKEYNGIVTGDGAAQLVGDKAHLNISPFDELGKEIRTGDPRHDTVGWDDNGYPWMRYRWWINDVQQQDTPEDHFLLSSIFSKFDPNHTFGYGMTPTLKLIRQWGSGKGKVTFQAFIDEERNGDFGYKESNIVGWYCD